MVQKRPDIDIDVASRAEAIDGHPCLPCSLLRDGVLVRHPTGLFYQSLPKDPVTGAVGFPSGGDVGDLLGSLGFFKIDVIPSHVYDHATDREQMVTAINSPDWGLFKRLDVVSQLQQIGGHAQMVVAYEPKTVEELAIMVAIIRPGKRWLIGRDLDFVRQHIWVKDESGYQFKKSHAFAYAMAIIVQAMTLPAI